MRQDPAAVFEELRRVIAEEVDAQTGVGRAVGDMARLIADAVLDYFDVTLKPGAGSRFKMTSASAAMRAVVSRVAAHSALALRIHR